MSAIYVVGIPQTGGCWLATGRYHPTFEAAMAEVNRDRESGIKSQVFTLYPSDPVTPDHASANGYDTKPDGSCKGGYLRNGKCTRCGATL